MKPIRLDLEGFGTFRDPATLDFSDTDYFALVGPTGAGKTTIIDGLCFALYGTVPRWPRKDQVSLAMAPSASHTRVALVFDAGGSRYAAVRVLARNAKGAVGTKQARLVELDPDADVSGDIADVLDQMVADLAASPDDVTDKVEKLLGLPWEHFVQCVVLPQNEFTKFLHAAPKERADVLISLLGLDVYGKVAALARQEEKTLAATEDRLRGQLDRYADATGDAEQEAARRLKSLQTLQRTLTKKATAITAASEQVQAATAVVDKLRSQLDALKAVTRPAGLDTLLDRRKNAIDAVTTATKHVTEAEQAEDETARVAEHAGDPHQRQQLVDDHENHQRLLAEIDTATETLQERAADRDAAGQQARAAEKALKAATEQLEQVRTEHTAADLAEHLHVGQDCPVCLRPVAELPDRPRLAELETARRDLATAEKAAREAGNENTAAQIAHGRAEDNLRRLHEQAEQLAGKLTGQPDLDTARAQLEEAVQASKAAKKAAAAYRDLRRQLREAEKRRDQANADTDTANRRFFEGRDRLVPYGAPAAIGDLAEDWNRLLDWAAGEASATQEKLSDAEAKEREAREGQGHLVAALAEELHAHGVPVRRTGEPGTFAAAVAGAVSDAKHAVGDIQRRRREAQELAEEAAAAAGDARLHRDLAVLLDGRHFERWLVQEALVLLVADASETLLELSGGQFQLELADRNAIEIVDHNDAGSRRPVRTLSGGETFQASLALALALSRRTAALSAVASRELDTILLDEGFGTLDAATLDTVATTLENLSGGGERTVGIVTHVPALADRTNVRFVVTRHGNHSTVSKVVGT